MELSFMAAGSTYRFIVAETVDSAPHVLYRAFDDGDRLLYVGITGCFPHRYTQHAYTAAWFDQACRWEQQVYPSLNAARTAELEAIRGERPLHNTRGREAYMRAA